MRLVENKCEDKESFDYFNSMTVCSLSRLYLFGAALIHGMLCGFFFNKFLEFVN